MATVTTQHSNAEVQRLIVGLVQALGGKGNEHADLVEGVKVRVGLTALGLIFTAFIEKAAGGTGSDGITWAPLKRATIASRRVGPGDAGLLKGAGIRRSGGVLAHRAIGGQDRDALGRVKRAFLTTAEDKRWRMIFATMRARLMGKYGLGEADASARAGQAAWAALKAEGAKTKLQVLGNRQVEIGRDTGRLGNSLSPGVANPQALPLGSDPPEPPAPAEADDRILRTDPGLIVVGSNVVYAGAFHEKRPLWPANGLPSAWEREIEQAAASGVMEAVVTLLAA